VVKKTLINRDRSLGWP